VLGVELVAHGGFHQGSPAPSSEATVQQQSSAPLQPQHSNKNTHTRAHNTKKTQKRKTYKIFSAKNNKVHNNSNNNSNNDDTQNTHNTHNAHNTPIRKKNRKGRYLNK
jgi:hypothetical protein